MELAGAAEGGLRGIAAGGRRPQCRQALVADQLDPAPQAQFAVVFGRGLARGLAELPLDPAAVGWDWVGLNLDDGGALMAFRIRDADGAITGDIRGIPSFRQGKVLRVEQWLADRGLRWSDLQHTTFYSDSHNDLPLLEKVHEPVATNPDERLSAVARERGWRILQLFE